MQIYTLPPPPIFFHLTIYSRSHTILVYRDILHLSHHYILIHFVDHSDLFNQTLPGNHLGCFQSFTITDSVAMNSLGYSVFLLYFGIYF